MSGPMSGPVPGPMSRRARSSACGHRGCLRPGHERLLTAATVLTFGRTAVTLVLASLGAARGSLGLLLGALAAYWLGDVADGALARATDAETRAGAVFDIVCDRLSAACFYVGFSWYDPTMIIPVGIYLAEFLVVDMFLSLAFLAWPLTSPNYFALVDQRIWRWNWSWWGKALNSSAFALLLVLTRQPLLAGAVALGLLGLKVTSLVWLSRLRIPLPPGCAATVAGALAAVGAGDGPGGPPRDGSGDGSGDGSSARRDAVV
jgi:CDP-diacylglycerol--glycerol-3-phosphate 3-phosphatidyltransferase